MDVKERIDKGNEALKLVDNPLLREAFEKAKTRAMDIFITSDPSDVAIREHQYLLLKAISEIESVIKGFIREGARAAAQTNKIQPNRLHNLDD